MCMNAQLCIFTSQVPCVFFLKYVCVFLCIYNLSFSLQCILPNLNFLCDKWMNKFLCVCVCVWYFVSPSVTYYTYNFSVL